MNPNDEVRKMIEARAARDREFPYKVGIFSSTYQQGSATDMLTPEERDIIGRGLSKGVDARNKLKVQGEVSIHHELRISSGMVVANCKDKISSDWLIDVIAKGHLKTLATKAGTPFRDSLMLVAKDIASCNPFMAFSVVNTNKMDSWMQTVSMLSTFDIETEGWMLVNSRSERNQLFTFIDTKRRLHLKFEGGRSGRRAIVCQRMGINITLRWAYGEDETGEILSEFLMRAFINLSIKFKAPQPHARRSHQALWTLWKKRQQTWTGARHANVLNPCGAAAYLNGASHLINIELISFSREPQAFHAHLVRIFLIFSHWSPSRTFRAYGINLITGRSLYSPQTFLQRLETNKLWCNHHEIGSISFFPIESSWEHNELSSELSEQVEIYIHELSYNQTMNANSRHRINRLAALREISTQPSPCSIYIFFNKVLSSKSEHLHLLESHSDKYSNRVVLVHFSGSREHARSTAKTASPSLLGAAAVAASVGLAVFNSLHNNSNDDSSDQSSESKNSKNSST